MLEKQREEEKRIRKRERERERFFKRAKAGNNRTSSRLETAALEKWNSHFYLL